MESKPQLSTLKNRSDFENLRKNGKTVCGVPWLIANYKINQNLGLRVGWTLPGYVGTSVTRNRLKRWIRVYLKTLSGEILQNPCDINLVFRKRGAGFYGQLTHKELDAALENIFKQIGRKTK